MPWRRYCHTERTRSCPASLLTTTREDSIHARTSLLISARLRVGI